MLSNACSIEIHFDKHLSALITKIMALVADNVVVRAKTSLGIDRVDGNGEVASSYL